MEDVQDVQETQVIEQPSAESGSTEVEAAPSEQNVQSETTPDPKGIAFGKALSAEREKIRKELEAEYNTKYKDYDTHKQLSEYLSEINGGMDTMTLKERVELERLEKRAEKEDVSPEVLKRIDELEAKAAKADELEAAQKQQQAWVEFEGTLKDFCKDKEIDGKALDHMDLWKYMHENEVTKPEIAYRSMRTEESERKANEKESETIKRYLSSKTAPKVEGSTGSAASQSVDTKAMTWEQLDRHAAERIKAMQTPQ